MKKYYDRIAVAYIFGEGLCGTIEQLGVYASMVKYTKDGEQVEELMDNEDFVIIDEIVFEHVEENN